MCIYVRVRGDCSWLVKEPPEGFKPEKAISETTQRQKYFLFPKHRVENFIIYKALGRVLTYKGFALSRGRKLALRGENATLVLPDEDQK